MTIPLRQSGEGITFAVRVKPRAKATRVLMGAEKLIVEVSAPPVEGKANEAVIAALAEALGVRRRQLSLVSGESGRDKVVRVEGLTMEELGERMERINQEAP